MRALDQFYFAEKLRYACAMMNDQGILAVSFEFSFVEELNQHLTAHPQYLEIPAIGIYYRIWRMLTQQDSTQDFEALVALIEQHGALFSAEEQNELYSYALNYCIRQIRNMREQYVAEALHLYERGIEQGVLLSEGQLSPWHFKNIVKLGLRSERFEWTEVFIREKSALLEASFRPDALHFSLADLFFYTKQYSKALEHLNRIAFTDIHYNLGAKEMLVKIYYLTHAGEAMYSQIHAFRVFLHRNRIIANEVRKAYLNFLKLLEKILHTAPAQRRTLREKIAATEPLVARAWLLEQV